MNPVTPANPAGPQAVQVTPADNVATLLAAATAGDEVGIRGQEPHPPVRAETDIPAGHKIALTTIPAGGVVVKYGYPIGHAVSDIRPGAHVHVHNVVGDRGRKDKQRPGVEAESPMTAGGDPC